MQYINKFNWKICLY